MDFLSEINVDDDDDNHFSPNDSKWSRRYYEATGNLICERKG